MSSDTESYALGLNEPFSTHAIAIFPRLSAGDRSKKSLSVGDSEYFLRGKIKGCDRIVSSKN